MLKLKNIKAELKAINNKWWNEERPDLDIKYYVPTDNICDALADHEIDIEKDKEFMKFLADKKEDDDIENYYIEYLELCDYKEVGGYNTYNWSGNVQNDMNWTIFESVDESHIIVVLSFHISGDVRCNYTEDVVLKFDDTYELWELFDEISEELYFQVEINGREYEVAPKILTDELEVYDLTNDQNIYGIHAIDDKELKEELSNIQVS